MYRPIGRAAACASCRYRKLHTATATLFDPNPGAGSVYSKVDITVGEPGEAYVMVKPQIGSILAGKYRFSFSTIPNTLRVVSHCNCHLQPIADVG